MNKDLDPYQVTISTWNKIAKIYQEKFMDLKIYNESYDFFCNTLPASNSSLLEIGCGPGNITKYILEKNPSFQILATDVSPNMIKLAKDNVPKVDFEILDARSLNAIKKTFDGIMVGFCLPYLSQEDVSQLIKTSSTLLNDNGILYLSAIEGKVEDSGYEEGSTGDKAFVYYHDFLYLKNLLNDNKFEITYNEKIPYQRKDGSKQQHLILISQKKQDEG
jgi:ubiquinone/menaquinone biosynthesis C-methylase UbiE